MNLALWMRSCALFLVLARSLGFWASPKTKQFIITVALSFKTFSDLYIFQFCPSRISLTFIFALQEEYSSAWQPYNQHSSSCQIPVARCLESTKAWSHPCSYTGHYMGINTRYDNIPCSTPKRHASALVSAFVWVLICWHWRTLTLRKRSCALLLASCMHPWVSEPKSCPSTVFQQCFSTSIRSPHLAMLYLARWPL